MASGGGPAHETGTVIYPRGAVMVFETVEISSSVEERREESPLVSWAAIIAGAIALPP